MPRDTETGREPLSGQTRRQSEPMGSDLSRFLRRRVETEASRRDRIARAIASADPEAEQEWFSANDAPQRYRRMAEAAVDAMEADR